MTDSLAKVFYTLKPAGRPAVFFMRRGRALSIALAGLRSERRVVFLGDINFAGLPQFGRRLGV